MKNSIFLLVFLLLFPSIKIISQWTKVTNGLGDRWTLSLEASGNNLFVGVGNPEIGAFVTTDNGILWTQTSLNNRAVWSFAFSGNYIFAGTNFYGVYSSSNNGVTWTQTSLNNLHAYTLLVNGNYLFAGTYQGVYLSTNNGTTWSQTSLNNGNVYGLALIGNNLFAGTSNPGDGVFFSTNNGTNWSQTSLNNQYVWALKAGASTLFAGTQNNGIFLSTNNGTTWSQTSVNFTTRALTVSGNNIFAGTDGGFYVSNNNGATWTQRNEGFVNYSPTINALCIFNNYIFAGTGNNNAQGVWRRPLSDLIGIEPISNEIPNQFSLSQNYPNPFNPTTKIRFDISGTSAAQTYLSVYDILGSEVATLVNEELKPGTYETKWDASNFVSGVYFYKLSTTDFTETKKMILIK